mmetsp:Transcript_65161/g.151331  ORF Transcript_65161/g.151331 Transcript_65161/m.151331 type:complete len:282 (+) Transcript_65161:119-964(+)
MAAQGLPRHSHGRMFACERFAATFDFLRALSSPSGQRWQWRHSEPLAQPCGRQNHAQGLQCPVPCKADPWLGDPRGGSKPGGNPAARFFVGEPSPLPSVQSGVCSTCSAPSSSWEESSALAPQVRSLESSTLAFAALQGVPPTNQAWSGVASQRMASGGSANRIGVGAAAGGGDCGSSAADKEAGKAGGLLGGGEWGGPVETAATSSLGMELFNTSFSDNGTKDFAEAMDDGGLSSATMLFGNEGGIDRGGWRYKKASSSWLVPRRLLHLSARGTVASIGS